MKQRLQQVVGRILAGAQRFADEDHKRPRDEPEEEALHRDPMVLHQLRE